MTTISARLSREKDSLSQTSERNTVCRNTPFVRWAAAHPVAYPAGATARPAPQSQPSLEGWPRPRRPAHQWERGAAACAMAAHPAHQWRRAEPPPAEWLDGVATPTSPPPQSTPSGARRSQHRDIPWSGSNIKSTVLS